MYADRITDSMAHAIEETNRRRAIQVAYNTEHGDRPAAAAQADRGHHRPAGPEDADTQRAAKDRDYGKGKRGNSAAKGAATRSAATGWPPRRPRTWCGLIEQLTEQMHAAAAELQFELAARLRDEVSDLKKELRQMSAPATPSGRQT